MNQGHVMLKGLLCQPRFYANNPLVLLGYGLKFSGRCGSSRRSWPLLNLVGAFLNVAKHSYARNVTAANMVLHKHRSATSSSVLCDYILLHVTYFFFERGLD